MSRQICTILGAFAISVGGVLVPGCRAAAPKADAPAVTTEQAPTQQPAAAPHHLYSGMRVEQMSRIVTLSDDQKTKLRALFKDTDAQIRTLSANTQLSRADRMKKLSDARAALDAGVGQILTQDQQQQLDAAALGLRVERAAAVEVKRYSSLGLTDDQAKKIQGIVADREKQLMLLGDDTALSAASRQKSVSGILARSQAAIQNILTPGQQQELDAQQAERMASLQMISLQKSYADMFTLTDDQVKQITAILVSAEKQAIPVRRDQSLDPKERGAKLLAIERQKVETIDKVLTPDQMQKVDAARMKRELDQQVQASLREYTQAGDLTDAEKQQITAIVADRAKQMQAIRADQTLSARDRGAKLGGVYAAARVQIENVLTPDQKAALLKERTNRQAQYQADIWVRRFGPTLQLTDQQTTDIKAVIMDEAQKVSTIMSDKTVKPAQRALQVRQFRVDSDTRIHGILTPDQQQKLAQAMKPPVGAGH